MKLTDMPEWVLRQKPKGTQIIVKKDGYYLYKIKSVWDPVKKRPRKITEKYLGKITEQGLVKSKHERVLSSINQVTIKEFGASALINYLEKDLKNKLLKYFPNDWEEIFSFAAFRLFESSPIKNLQHHFTHSYFSDIFSKANLLPKNTSQKLEKIGSDREQMTLFMKDIALGSNNLIVDLTHIFSSSENINSLSFGHNSEGDYHKQVNMLLLFSKDKNEPVYFRMLDGAIRDISSIKNTIEESGIEKVIFVGDKGFFSETNQDALLDKHIEFILPLKRNSTLINYDVMRNHSKKSFDGYFFFNKRHIWYKEQIAGDKRIILFFDEKLKVDETNSFLSRVDKEHEELSEFHEKEFTFGTISVMVNNKKLPAKEVYEFLKARTNIENVFDAFKNILEADKTHMQSDAKLHGWMFINFIALKMYYTIYGILLKHELLDKYSPRDILLHFSKVQKVKIGEKHIISEIPKTTRILAEKMKLPEDLLLKL